MEPQSFNHFLRERQIDSGLRSLLYHIARSVKYINFSIRAGNTEKIATQNTFGETQMALDVLADTIITNELERSELAACVASEEQKEPQKFDASRGQYLVAYDPLDGSSLVNANLSIGSIFGIWDKPSVIGETVGNSMVASAYAVYGPRITLTIAVKDKGVHEFELNDVGEFILTRADISIEPETKYFAPGNLKAALQNQGYRKVVDHWLSEGRKLRYSGGMVPDLHHMLCKSQGIFSYPDPGAKLRLLFECAPFALVFQEAGGLALDQTSQPILDIKVKDCHQTTSIVIGSKSEVKNVVAMMQN